MTFVRRGGTVLRFEGSNYHQQSRQLIQLSVRVHTHTHTHTMPAHCVKATAGWVDVFVC